MNVINPVQTVVQVPVDDSAAIAAPASSGGNLSDVGPIILGVEREPIVFYTSLENQTSLSLRLDPRSPRERKTKIAAVKWIPNRTENPKKRGMNSPEPLNQGSGEEAHSLRGHMLLSQDT